MQSLNLNGGVDNIKFNDAWGGGKTKKYVCSNNFPYFLEEGGNHNQEVLKSISKSTVSFADIGTPVMKDNAGSSSMTVQIQTCNVYGCR